MTAPESPAGWRDFAIELSQIAQVESEQIKPDVRLVEDLGLDSLALTEVIVFVLERYNPASFRQLEDRTWEGVTARQLFDECMRAAP